MRKGLGLSEQAIHRIGRSLHSQAYARDPSSGDFVMPGGSSGVSTFDTESRLKALEDNLGNLQVQMQDLQMLGTSISDLQSQVQELQQSAMAPPGGGAGGQPGSPEQPWQPTSWWDRFKQVVMPDQIPGAEQPEQYQENNPAFQYIGSKRRR